MVHPDLLIACMALAGMVLGSWHLCWSQAAHDSVRGLWCRLFGVGALLCLGTTGLIAAGLHSAWLGPLGLMAGIWVVIMLWESPEPGWNKMSGE